MATTLQDLQAKRKELQATNPNATMLDAKSAISPIQNAPIAGQAPAIAPVAPTPVETPMNVNQKVLANNQAKVQSEIAAGTRPEVGTKATPEQTPAIIQQAQTQTAQANKETPTAPVAPTETATTQTENKSSNPISTTSNVSNQQVVTPDSNSIYTSLRSNVPVADITKNTQAYKDAQARYNNFQKYASYDVNTLTTALSNGTILPGTSTWNDLMTDPVMGGKILQAKALTNGKGADYTSTTQNVSDTIVSNSPVVSGMLADGQITAEEWATATNTPEVTAKMADVEAKKNAYDTLKAKYDDVETQVKADFPGSPFADSIIADRRKSMFKELTIAGDTYNNALGTLTQLKTDASNLFETNMKLYQDQKAVENQKAMIEYTAKVGLQSKIAEQQVADELARQAQNDPTKAIPALIAQYTEMGVPMQRSTQEIVQEAQNEIANGGTLASYLTNLQKTIQSKPEYKRIQAQEAGKGISYQTIGDKVYKNENGVLTLTDISAKSTPSPVWQEWTDSNGVKQAGWITPGVNPITSTGVKGTGNIVPVTAGGKTVRLDQVGASGFENAVNQLTANGTPLVFRDGVAGFRDQVQTIKEMALENGIAFNPSNPSETAQKLRNAGHSIADPGKSEHENGMAIDVYGSSKLDAVTPEQEKVLNANGWYSAGIPGDAGHFEYRGGGTQATGGALSDLGQYMIDNQDRGAGYSNDDVKAFNEKIARLVKAGDEDGMAIAYRNMVMKDKDFKKDFDDTQKFSKALDTVQTMVNDYEKAGKDTNALKKVAETIGRKLGLTTDTALAQLQTQMGVTMANYIKSISGTAASDAEVVRLMGNMANIGNISELNTAIISTVKDNAQNGLKSMIDTRMYGMPEELKPKVFGDIYGQTSQAPQDKWSTVMDVLSKAIANKPTR